MRTWAKLLTAVLLLGGSAFAQNFYTFQGKQYPNGVFYVCAVPASGNPCTNQVNIYPTSGLVSPINQPATIAPDGSYGFWVAGTQAQITIQIQTPYSIVYIVNMGGGTGGGIGYPTGSGIPTVSSGSAWGTTLTEANGSVAYGSGGAWTVSNAPAISAANMTSFPTFNQNTTGTASNVTGIVAIANGGTGNGTTVGAYNYFGNGTGSSAAPAFGTIPAAAIPTLNQNTTGNAGTVSTAASTTNSAFSILAVPNTSGSQEPNTIASFTINPSTGAVNVPGALTVSSCSGCGSGTPGTPSLSVQYDNAGSFGGASLGTNQGTYLVGRVNTTQGTATAPIDLQQGDCSNSTINGSTSTYTVLYSDVSACNIIHDRAGSASVTVTLPTPTTLNNTHPVFAYQNDSGHSDTITPTTYTIALGNGSAAASQTIPSNVRCRIGLDPFNASVWDMSCAPNSTSGGGGAVSSVSNSDGTMSVTPTTGAVVASLDIPAISNPSGTPTGTPSSSGGTVAAGSNYAKIIAFDSGGRPTAAGTESALVTTTTGTSSIAWNWTAVTGASSYYVCVGSTSGAESNCFSSATNSYTQTTAISTGTTAFVISATNYTGGPNLTPGGGTVMVPAGVIGQPGLCIGQYFGICFYQNTNGNLLEWRDASGAANQAGSDLSDEGVDLGVTEALRYRVGGVGTAFDGCVVDDGTGTNTLAISAPGTGNCGSPSANAHTGNLSLTKLNIFGTTSGSTTLSASATGGTLNLGSTNATVTSAGAAAVTQLLASGIVDGQAPVTLTTGTTASLGGTYQSGYTFNQEGTAATAVTYTLPTPAAGKQYCIKNSYNGSAANTGVLTLAVATPGTHFIIYNGTKGTSTGTITSGGAAGDAMCAVAISATLWEAYVQVGTWTLH
jgi:trimeric autotransporter adhesin